MKHQLTLIALLLLALASALFSEEDALFGTVDGKIKALMETEVVEVTGAELAALSDGAMKKRVARALGRAYAGDEMADALIDYIEVGNCRLVNVLHLDGGRLFVNVLVRSDGEPEPKNGKSAEMLDRGLFQHHVFFLYDPAKKEIPRIQYTRANYTPIAFHRHDYGGADVLYAIANNSSFGMATTDVYLFALSAETLDLLFSECVLYAQEFYSDGVDDILFCKDFAFEKNTARFAGKDFDFDRYVYTDYEKQYTLP